MVAFCLLSLAHSLWTFLIGGIDVTGLLILRVAFHKE